MLLGRASASTNECKYCTPSKIDMFLSPTVSKLWDLQKLQGSVAIGRFGLNLNTDGVLLRDHYSCWRPFRQESPHQYHITQAASAMRSRGKAVSAPSKSLAVRGPVAAPAPAPASAHQAAGQLVTVPRDDSVGGGGGGGGGPDDGGSFRAVGVGMAASCNALQCAGWGRLDLVTDVDAWGVVDARCTPSFSRP